jgi:hypothetical protein
MPRTNGNGQVRVYERDGYIYYVASITILRKTYKKYFEYKDEGKELANKWIFEKQCE